MAWYLAVLIVVVSTIYGIGVLWGLGHTIEHYNEIVRHPIKDAVDIFAALFVILVLAVLWPILFFFEETDHAADNTSI